MYYEVTALRRKGERLHPEQWPAAEFGSLEVVESDPRSVLQRRCRVVHLVQAVGVSSHRIARILVEPRVVLLPLGDMVWEGTEIDSSGAVPVEVSQAWLIRRRDLGAQPLEPFDWRRWNEERRRPT